MHFRAIINQYADAFCENGNSFMHRNVQDGKTAQITNGGEWVTYPAKFKIAKKQKN